MGFIGLSFVYRGVGRPPWSPGSDAELSNSLLSIPVSMLRLSCSCSGRLPIQTPSSLPPPRSPPPPPQTPNYTKPPQKTDVLLLFGPTAGRWPEPGDIERTQGEDPAYSLEAQEGGQEQERPQAGNQRRRRGTSSGTAAAAAPRAAAQDGRVRPRGRQRYCGGRLASCVSSPSPPSEPTRSARSRYRRACECPLAWRFPGEDLWSGELWWCGYRRGGVAMQES